jgi:hypothetical protein
MLRSLPKIGPRKRQLDRKPFGTRSSPKFRTLADFKLPISHSLVLGNPLAFNRGELSATANNRIQLNPEKQSLIPATD